MDQSQRRRLAAAAAEKRLRGEVAGDSETTARSAADPADPRASELLEVFDKAHAQAVARHRNTGQDAHHAPALRKAKKAVQESLARGDNLTLSSLHTLKNVGHWVVSQLRENLEGANSSSAPAAKRQRQVAEATPESFSWWYVNAAGKRVEFRNDAQMKDGPAGETFRVTIMHSSGRVEKAWLPDAKAPPTCVALRGSLLRGFSWSKVIPTVMPGTLSAELPINERLSAISPVGMLTPEEEISDDELDATDAGLSHLEKRLRMSSCMELVKQQTGRSVKEVEHVVAETSRLGGLSEFDAKNYLFHTWLVKCYHNIRQEEAQSFGAQEFDWSDANEHSPGPELPRSRVQQLFGGSLQRFSEKQLEVLNELLREDGALGPEVEVLGKKLSQHGMAPTIGLAAAVLCAGLLLFLAWRLLSARRKDLGLLQCWCREAASLKLQLLSNFKCENILLKHDGIKVEDNIFKLCDFGFAAHDSGEGLTDRLGSPDTVAPEIVVGTKYSTPVDMWSAGVLVYMMLSATPPFYAPTDNEVLRKVKTGSYNLSGEPWDSLPKPPKDLIASLMTVDPKKRPTATEALNVAWLK
eukprot:s1390_g1.t2